MATLIIMMTLKIWAWIKKFFIYNAKDLAECCNDPDDCKKNECIDPKLIKGTKKYYYASRRKKQPKKKTQYQG
ncbi:MAG: hypothetical protein CM15mV120_360 [uncultured marine virus]|nr:MAG: hypothetical protein CM15mV120_360 [uncultured marine virus]